MKAWICEQPGVFRYDVKEIPMAQKGNALLRIRRIGICGTDLHAFEGTQPFFSYPRILGHELAAEIAAIDGGGTFAVGDRVTFIPYFHCGHCIACRNGLTNCCTDIKVFGVHIDGGMQEFVSVPVQYLVQGGDMAFDELALVEPLAIGAHGIRRAGVKAGELVAVIGAGPIGLGVMEFARISGAQVIAIDVNERRLQFCRERLQVVHTINPSATDTLEALQTITGGDMPAVVIDATGNLNAINQGFRYLAHGGRYVLVGLQKAEIAFSHPEFHKREATLMSSRNATREDFDHVLACMRNRQIDPATYITHCVQFSEIGSRFESWLNPASGVIKAMALID
ncbi:zinc-binding alcohol dehydrogenase family protein [Sediminibacterium soli]|uniref:zinc-binding alcohol dehydrogenase family protein n=1 Tax=Sediminibacterium soli TaxID=2698829 RepID=UPI0013796FF4|nr:zinc-binding alcohol dehydrogenase family protein [Sediminibacterium soli]NCI48173.1 zinc-binding alcohol dehydrogenase family protein [Sediminibacterium soli]